MCWLCENPARRDRTTWRTSATSSSVTAGSSKAWNETVRTRRGLTPLGSPSPACQRRLRGWRSVLRRESAARPRVVAAERHGGPGFAARRCRRRIRRCVRRLPDGCRSVASSSGTPRHGIRGLPDVGRRCGVLPVRRCNPRDRQTYVRTASPDSTLSAVLRSRCSADRESRCRMGNREGAGSSCWR